MLISKKIAKELIEDHGSKDNLVWVDDVLKGPGENGGFEHYCIIEDITTQTLYRFIYEQKENGTNMYYKDVQLTPVMRVATTVYVYEEI